MASRRSSTSVFVCLLLPALSWWGSENSGVWAFVPNQRFRSPVSSTTVEAMKEEGVVDCRRSFLTKVVEATCASGVLMNTGLLGGASPAQAVSGVKKVNMQLSNYGLPTLPSVPKGFTPLLEIYGKGSNRSPLLVQFVHPVDWIVTLPSQDANGEDGTIQAGEYAKGDTATLFVYTAKGKVSNVAEQPKDFFQEVLIKAISQKGDNVYQNFKVTSVSLSPTTDGTYVGVDFKYQLLTGAGFEVDRKGVASVTSVGNAVEVLWTASTSARYKKTEPRLREIASSFRCYADGLKLVDNDVDLSFT